MEFYKKIPLGKKATGNHLVKSTSLEKAQSPVSGFCYPQNRVCQTLLVRKALGNHLMESTSLEKAQSPVSGFCYARNRVCNAAVYKTIQSTGILRRNVHC